MIITSFNPQNWAPSPLSPRTDLNRGRPMGTPLVPAASTPRLPNTPLDNSSRWLVGISSEDGSEVNQPFQRPSSRIRLTIGSSGRSPGNTASRSTTPVINASSNVETPKVDEDESIQDFKKADSPPETWRRPVTVGRYTPSPRLRLVEPALAINFDALAMPPPPVPVKPSATALGKRKAEFENPDGITNSPQASGLSSLVRREREPSSTPDVKPVIPIPILPIPLPSKRYRKHTTAKALLIPVEQLPVFALPPMPPIEDANLLKQVFTHESLFERPRWKFEDPIDNPSLHYEKLEHVGDSILGVIVTTWLHESRPNLTIGTATKLKAHLVSNATLSHLSGLYNLPQRLNGHPELLPVLRAQTDVRAALMEAYIAGLYFSFPVETRLGEGLKTIDSWLREMYEPLYDFFYNYMKKEYEQHNLTIGSTLDGKAILMTNEKELEKINESSTGMSNLISMYCSTQERDLYWQEEKLKTNQGILWKIKCLIDGIELSEAIRPNRKLARNVAGWEAAKKLGLTSET